jgi:hypothetical protein
MAYPDWSDAAESARVKRLKKRSNENRVTLPTRAHYAHNGGNRERDSTFRFSINRQHVELSESGMMSVIVGKMFSRANAIVNNSPGVHHVKDGKPLTEHGAKLLGVPWPRQ